MYIEHKDTQEQEGKETKDSEYKETEVTGSPIGGENIWHRDLRTEFEDAKIEDSSFTYMRAHMQNT